MKTLLAVFMTLVACNAFAQEAADSAKVADTALGHEQNVILDFCGQQIALLDKCAVASRFEVRCEDYQLTWNYLNYADLGALAEQLTRQMEKKKKGVITQPIECYLLDVESKGYKTSTMLEDNTIQYQLMAFAAVRGQPVVVQLTLKADPRTNADLPEFARQVLRLHKQGPEQAQK